MSNRSVRRVATISAAVAIVVAIAGILTFGLSSPSRAFAAPALKECPSGEVITVTAPAASAPTTVNVTVAPPVNLKPAKDAVVDSYHLHYFVDIDPATVAQAGQPVPTGNPKIIHSAATTQDVGALAPGKHTVWVVLGDVGHIVCTPVVQASVSFDVSAAAALPASGSLGPINGDRPFGLVGVMLLSGLFVATAGFAWRRTGRRPA